MQDKHDTKTMGMLTINYFDDVAAFHEKFDLAYDGPPRELPPELLEFRWKFLNEELNEFKQGLLDDDLEQQLDALVDLVYVALGTAYLMGLPFQEVWSEVQACNMRKVKAGPNGEGSKRGSPHDVIKPPGWEGPRIKEILLAAMARHGN